MFVEDKVLVANAIGYGLSVFKELVADDVVKRPHLAVVVATRTSDGSRYNVIETMSAGDPSEWEHPYDEVAQGKTRLSARTGLSSREVQELRPELLVPNDVRYWGNAVEGNLIVSCSGVQPWFDELIAKIILAAIKALADDRRRELAEQNPDSSAYNGSW